MLLLEVISIRFRRLSGYSVVEFLGKESAERGCVGERQTVVIEYLK